MRLRCSSVSGPLLLALLIIGCDRAEPLEPAIQAASAAASGSTPSAPSGTNAVAASESRIDVSWLDNSTNETGFEVYRSTGGPGGAYARRASTDADVAGYGDVGLTPVTEYCYKVRASRTSGRKTTYSQFSAAACATTPAPPPPPGPPNVPSWVNAWPAASTVVSVSWDDNSENEDGFRVERSTDGGAIWSLAVTVVASPGLNARWFDDGGRVTDHRVCYRVIAFNGEGESPPSNADCATPPAGPSALVLDTQGNLSWTDNSLVEDSYEVWMLDAYGVAYEGLVATLPANSTTLLVGDCGPAWCWGYAVVATKEGGYSDWAAVITRSQ